MSGDNEIIEPDEVADASKDIEVASNDTVKPRKRTSLLSLMGGLIIALGAGGVGGFAAHEYLKPPHEAPDLSAFEARFSALDKSVAAQTQWADRLEQQVKKINEQVSVDISALEAKWSKELLALEGLMANKAAPLEGEDVTDDAKSAESPDTPAQSIDAEPPDIHPDLLARVAEMRREFDQDITAINARLEILETTPETPSDAAGNPKNLPVPFPADRFLAQLDGAPLLLEKQGRLGKFLKKHVSVSTTAHADGQALLQKMKVAIAGEEWDRALALSQDLPEPVRTSTQEWIAGARP